jgi:hypothetical protein
MKESLTASNPYTYDAKQKKVAPKQIAPGVLQQPKRASKAEPGSPEAVRSLATKRQAILSDRDERMLEDRIEWLRSKFPDEPGETLRALAMQELGLAALVDSGRAQPKAPQESEAVKRWREKQPAASPNFGMINPMTRPIPPQSGAPALPPQKKDISETHNVSGVGGSKVYHPKHIAEQAQQQREYEQYMREMAMYEKWSSSQQSQQEAALLRQQKELEMQRLREEFELERLRMEQERKKLQGSQFGTIGQGLMETRQPVTQRQPTYLGG